MNNIIFKELVIYILFMPVSFSSASNDPGYMFPLETEIIKPIEMECISIWIPAEKLGPVVNRRSCRLVRDYSWSYELSSNVQHTKAANCPDEAAKQLAEYAAYNCGGKIPLTIFNGWQWEYPGIMSQWDSGTYGLAGRGEGMENCWETILTGCKGNIEFNCINMTDASNSAGKSIKSIKASEIEVSTFSSRRTRNGYPKKYKFEQYNN